MNFKTLAPLKSLNPYIYRYRRMMILGSVFVVISNLFAVYPAQIVRQAIDKSLNQLNSVSSAPQINLGPVLLQFAGLIIGMAVLRGIFMYFMRNQIITMSRHIEYDLKNNVYSHLQKQSLAFYRRNNTGDLMARMSEDISRVRMYLGPVLLYSINIASLLILVVGIMVSVDLTMSIFILLPLPILAVSIYVVNSIVHRKSTAIQEQLSKLTTIAQESFSGIRILKSFPAIPHVISHFADEAQTYKKNSMSLVKTDAFFFPLIVLLIGLSTLLTLYIGGQGVISGRLTPGTIVEFFIYVGMLSWPVASIGWITSLAQRAAASQKRIDHVLNTEPEVDLHTGIHRRIDGKVQFDEIVFTYPDTGLTALNGLSFEIAAGGSLGIIGKTGSGKSTIVNLLDRFYDPTAGRILIDDIDLKEYNTAHLREQIGYTFQDDFLFSESIRDNMLFGSIHGGKTDEEIEEAARNADVLKDIHDFPKGFETMLGERGITLSGGQKQRVSIARALLSNPKILILDDCFSALDAKTEAAILSQLKKVMAGRTTIIISHRVSAVCQADNIIVLDGGRVEESGTHEQLIGTGGYYASLYQKQQVEAELNARETQQA